MRPECNQSKRPLRHFKSTEIGPMRRIHLKQPGFVVSPSRFLSRPNICTKIRRQLSMQSVYCWVVLAGKERVRFEGQDASKSRVKLVGFESSRRPQNRSQTKNWSARPSLEKPPKLPDRSLSNAEPLNSILSFLLGPACTICGSSNKKNTLEVII